MKLLASTPRLPLASSAASAQRERLSGLLEEVGKRDGIENLRLGQEGTAALELAGGRKIFFEYREEAALFLLYMPLFVLPADATQRLALCEAMLDRNFLKLRTGWGELAFLRETQEAVYQIALDTASLTADDLDRAIDCMLEQYVANSSALESIRPQSSRPRLLTRPDTSRLQLLASLKRG